MIAIGFDIGSSFIKAALVDTETGKSIEDLTRDRGKSVQNLKKVSGIRAAYPCSAAVSYTHLTLPTKRIV